MCMGGGGGGSSKAKINTFDKERKAATQQLNEMVGAIDKVTRPNSKLRRKQRKLNKVGKALGEVLDRAVDLQTAAANSPAMVGQNALQLAALMGPPPPEKSATKVVVGKDRGVETDPERVRRSLRIDPTSLQ